ncbi:MAG TPA: adenosine kinase [Fimbriiglobus sp.]|jgi:sugar/nucleoside kinase (ribokinase family)
MKRYHLCGLGNALVDLIVDVSDAEFESLGFERGTMRLVDAAEQKTLLDGFAAKDPRLVSGGSVGNSTIGFAQLGGRAAFVGVVGDDRYGLHYQGEFDRLGIALGNPVVVGQPTGTCVSVVTPDAERTMRTCLAVNTHLSADHVAKDRDLIAQSEWLFVEGYLFANPESGQGAIREAIKIARESGTKVAITCSEAFIVHVFGPALFDALKQADLFFCNATEACAAANAHDSQEAFQKLKNLVPNAVVTDGPAGAYVRWQGTEHHIPAFPCEPKDLTGAGDMFAGSFLYGVTHGIAPEKAAKAANYLAMKVITQVGARLHSGVKEFWKSHV